MLVRYSLLKLGYYSTLIKKAIKGGKNYLKKKVQLPFSLKKKQQENLIKLLVLYNYRIEEVLHF